VSQIAVAGPSRLAACPSHVDAESQDEDDDDWMAEDQIDDNHYADYPWYD
jgi:hypothetical protein